MLKIYNTLKKEKEVFKSIKENEVKMYVCGVTVYDEPHLGHARAYVAFDIIKRYLQYKNYKVTYVRNITDIDDKIIKKAASLTDNPSEIPAKCTEITEKYYNCFIENINQLNIEAAEIEPKATEHIDDIIEIIQTLINKDLAYTAGGDVFFRVDQFKDYGKLSGKKLEDLQAGNRIDVNDIKENPFDFVLWKQAKPNEPFWSSPWGDGRPGWHIECSAMSNKYLGETFDIHGGGQDLIFPHHENEVAQSEGASGKPFVKYWIHNGFVTINKEKMSKSLGNFSTLNNIFKEFEPRFVRFFLLAQRYRSPLDFSEEALKAAREAMQRIDNALGHGLDKIKNLGNKSTKIHQEVLDKFTEAMDDDFNTSLAVSYLFEEVTNLNTLIKNNGCLEEIQTTINTIEKICSVLGIEYKPVEIKNISDGEVNEDISAEDILSQETISENDMETLIKLRLKARKEKDFKTADYIRNTLSEKKIILRDTPAGTEWSHA